MKHFYLFGQNISSSLSPTIHNNLFKLKDLSKNIYLPAKNLSPFDLLYLQTNQQFAGASITIPYKKYYSSQQIKFNCEVSKLYGIINTITKDKDLLEGYNTDIFGVQKCFQDKLTQIQHKNVLLIGAGATAEIFCHYFQQISYDIFLVNRSIQRIASIKQNIKKVKVKMAELLDHRTTSKSEYARHQVIVNTLPSEVVYANWSLIQNILKESLAVFPQNQKAFIVYMNVNYRKQLDPIEQFLKKHAKVSEVHSITGMSMLIWQAIEQNRLFCLEKQTYNKEQENWYFNKIKKQLNV